MSWRRPVLPGSRATGQRWFVGSASLWVRLSKSPAEQKKLA